MKGVPYVIVGGLRFYERKEIKDILAYLKLVGNPGDIVAFRRIVNLPRRGIGEATVAKLESIARERGLPIYLAARESKGLGLGFRAERALEGFCQIIDEILELAKHTGVTEITEAVLDKTGYIHELLAENTRESQNRIENLNEFLTRTQEFDLVSDEGNLWEFLGEISLITDLDQSREASERDAVWLMTMHMAKGLEFDRVFLAGLEEGIFPHFRSLMDANELEEERRLCYVALTRAKKELFLSYARRRSLFGKTSSNPPSRFLGEIPLTHLAQVKLAESIPDSDYQRTLSPRKKTGFSFEPSFKSGADMTDSFVAGDRVLHAKWGEGVVVSVRGQGNDAEYQVAFPDGGIKKLLALYAPLSRA